MKVIQTAKNVTRIANVDAWLDEANYINFTLVGENWHITMKDETRWHVSRENRSMSYWFEVKAGNVESVKPKKTEYGNHREKHKELDEAPSEVKNFIAQNITELLRVK